MKLKGNWIIVTVISGMAMVGCLSVFSTVQYEKAFNCVLVSFKNMILKK